MRGWSGLRLGTLLVVGGLVAQALPGFGQTIEDARRVQASVLGVDSHNDTMQRVLIENVDLGQRLPDGMVDLPRLREGGMHVPFFALWAPAYYPGSEAVRRTLDLRDAAQRVFDKYPEQVEMATSARDIQRIVGQKKIAAVLAIEGGHQIDSDLAVLRMYRRAGGFDEASNCHAFGVLCVLGCAEEYEGRHVPGAGQEWGVVGVNFGSAFLNQKDAAELKQKIAQRNELDLKLLGPELDAFAAKEYATSGDARPQVGNATVDDAAECIDHIVKVAGLDHVGIGSDFDGVSSLPIGLEDVSKMPDLTLALMKRGYSEADIKKIMGENTLRVIREVVGY